MVIFLLLFLLAPLAVGGIFADKGFKHGGVIFAWISGQILLWAVFQLVCVPMVLKEMSFLSVVSLFLRLTVLLAFCGCVCYLFKLRKKAVTFAVISGESKSALSVKLLWVVFAVLLLVQLVLAVVLAYEEGDDAYYVALSTITIDSNEMYMKLPYTIGWTGLDARHGLAPFPIWVAYLAELASIPAVTMAQVILPVGLIVMTYGIYYLIGDLLFEKKRNLLPMFMIVIAVIVFFGGYSTYSAENFLLVRTAQGKAVIANIILPFMVYLFLRMLNTLEERGRSSAKVWLLIGLAMVCGCLCSTLGSLLTCILVGIVGGLALICYRKWSLLFPMALCCVCPVACAFLYFVCE